MAPLQRNKYLLSCLQIPNFLMLDLSKYSMKIPMLTNPPPPPKKRISLYVCFLEYSHPGITPLNKEIALLLLISRMQNKNIAVSCLQLSTFPTWGLAYVGIPIQVHVYPFVLYHSLGCCLIFVCPHIMSSHVLLSHTFW